MNDLGNLATNIVDYHLGGADSTDSVTFVSGWLDANLGQLNGYTFEEFSIDSSGDFDPSLEPVEEAIFTSLYEIDYYDRSVRATLRSSSANTGASDWTMIREGDSIVQRTSKHLIAREYKSYRDAAESRLDDLVAKYEIYKASPLQVAGTDGVAWPISINE